MTMMRLAYWLTFPWIPRRVLKSIAIIVLVPAVLLGGAVYLAQDPNTEKELQIAALKLTEDMQKTPLRMGGPLAKSASMIRCVLRWMLRLPIPTRRISSVPAMAESSIHI
jgi:hypothetical protein